MYHEHEPDYEKAVNTKVIAIAECAHEDDTVDDIIADSLRITYCANSRYGIGLSDRDVRELAPDALFYAKNGFLP